MRIMRSPREYFSTAGMGTDSSLRKSATRTSRAVRYASTESSTLPSHTSTPDAVTHAAATTQYRATSAKSVPP